mgnify:CR=1 FL=1
MFNKIDIDPSNVYTFDEGATKENVHRYCKQYETLIDSFGGIDYAPLNSLGDVECRIGSSFVGGFHDFGIYLFKSCE